MKPKRTNTKKIFRLFTRNISKGAENRRKKNKQYRKKNKIQ